MRCSACRRSIARKCFTPRWFPLGRGWAPHVASRLHMLRGEHAAPRLQRHGRVRADRTTVAWVNHPDTTDGAHVRNGDLSPLYQNYFYDKTRYSYDKACFFDEGESKDDEDEKTGAGPSGKQPKRERSPATTRRSRRGRRETTAWPEI